MADIDAAMNGIHDNWGVLTFVHAFAGFRRAGVSIALQVREFQRGVRNMEHRFAAHRTRVDFGAFQLLFFDQIFGLTIARTCLGLALEVLHRNTFAIIDSYSSYRFGIEGTWALIRVHSRKHVIYDISESIPHEMYITSSGILSVNDRVQQSWAAHDLETDDHMRGPVRDSSETTLNGMQFL